MVTGIILASGFSRRMQKDKLLLELDGTSLVERVIRAAAVSRLEECILVFRDPAVRAIGESYGLKTVYNPLAHEGQSAAVRLGVEHVSKKASAYLFMVGDQPFLTPDVINRFIERHKNQPQKILMASYCGKRGNPVLFSAVFRADLLSLSGDAGGRQIISQVPEQVAELAFENQQCGIDIDTPETYRRWAELVEGQRDQENHG